jgi:hypothetical protein
MVSGVPPQADQVSGIKHGAWGRGHGVKDSEFRDSGIEELKKENLIYAFNS